MSDGQLSLVPEEPYRPNPAGGEALRDEAETRVERNADPYIKRLAIQALQELAYEQAVVTSDDVWLRIQVRPHEPRMLGPIMKSAEKKGWIRYTERTVLSVLEQNHRRPIRVWLSLLYRAAR